VPGGSGDALRRFASDSGGPRLTVLWTFAPGDKPRPPFAPALYRTFGRAVARLHALSDDFVSPHAAARDALDRERLIERPLALALPLVSDADERCFLASVGARLSAALDALISEGLDWGPVHGDATLDNLHVTEGGGIVLYDFDSGGPGWRALDLQGWSFRDPAYAPVRDAFLEGYADVRPVRPADLRAAPYLTVAADVWGIGIDLERRVLSGGEDAAAEYLRERVAFLRTRVRDLLND
jgi:Ser/Thr protein kinase RdoA (MazF antagonist)